MANELHTFTGNEVIATELPELLNQNFDYVRENSLKSVNGVEKDENNNVDVTFLTSQVIPTNSDLNNFRESGEYTREVDTVVVTNSPTEKPFFLTVLASENLVKQVVTEIDRKDPMTFTRTLSGANWSPWVEGGVDIGIWKSEETVKVGDVRFLKGRENAGYVLECVTAGVTGENQPVLEGNIAEEVFDLNNFDGTLSIEKGGTRATTAEEARENLGITPANIGALPLSGGVMEGNISFLSQYCDIGFMDETHNHKLSLWSGSTNSAIGGAALLLHGSEFDGVGVAPGVFQLVVGKTESTQPTISFVGYPDGRLTWNAKDVARIHTYNSNDYGYIELHNGLIFAWAGASWEGTSHTITKPKAFTTLRCFITEQYGSGIETYSYGVNRAESTTTTDKIYSTNKYTNLINVFWIGRAI